ncbi:hypothetical protein [Candidatus Electronema sp. PJ]|uniref:hypothetical protein n=1 Tax=Candidatus Electronema sp. PJ TaxID=3401572 RepID=UPI003AA80398
MKKRLVLLFFLLLSAQPALAEWTEGFTKDFEKLGLDRAIENALDNEITPQEILTFIVSNSEQFNTRLSLKTLYCAGVDRDTVREAADKLGITVEEVSVALEESLAECGSKLALNDRDITEVRDSGGVPLPPPPEEPPVDARKLLEPPRSSSKHHYASPSTPNQH